MTQNPFVINVSYSGTEWELDVPGIDEPVRCRRMSEAKAALYDARPGGQDAYLNEMTSPKAILKFTDDESAVANSGSQVLVAASSWGPIQELIVTHDFEATDRHVNVFQLDHPGVAEDGALAIFLDRDQAEWLSRWMGSAAQRLPHPNTGDWDPNVFAW